MNIKMGLIVHSRGLRGLIVEIVLDVLKFTGKGFLNGFFAN